MSQQRVAHSLDQLDTGAPSSAPAALPIRPIFADETDAVFFHFDILRSLRLYRKLVMPILALGLAVVLVYVLKSWPMYAAESLLYIQPAPPHLLATGPNQTWPYDANTYESFMQQQVNNATRSDVLLSALHALPAGSWQRPEESEQAAVERLGRAIKVERVGSSYQISITARASKAAFAAQIANAVASSFVEIAKADLRAGDPQRIQLLTEERDRIQKALADDRAEQESLNKTLGVAAVYNTTDPYDAQISALRVELAKARAASDEAGARLATLGRNATSSAAIDAEADDLIAADAGLVSMKTSLSQRRAILISQMANLTPNHPQYKQDADELAKINASLEAMMKDLRAKAAVHIQQRMKNDLERTSTIEARLNAQVGQLASAAGSASPRLQRSNDLATDIQRLQNRFTVVDEQYRNLAMENKAPGAASISASALPPLHPSTSRMLRGVLVILIGSMVLALSAAVAAHNLDPRIYIATDVERVLGFSPMAQLPDFHEVSSGVGDEYMLRLAAAMEHSYQQGGFRTCIVTAAGPGAGTTTVATRVSTMLEGMGRSTVLVSASGKPSPSPEDGSAEGTVELVTIRQENRPSALLQQMADEMESDTIVLTDTAPLLASGETEYLARFVDSAIVIIQSGLTTRAQLREVAQTLQRLKVSAVGFVLNRISIEKANPSFRRSVRAVAQRLELQSRLYPHRSSRPRPSAQHASETDQEPSSVPKPEPVKPPEVAKAPEPSPQPAVEPVASGRVAAVADQTPLVADDSVSARTPRSARGGGTRKEPLPHRRFQNRPSMRHLFPIPGLRLHILLRPSCQARSPHRPYRVRVHLARLHNGWLQPIRLCSNRASPRFRRESRNPRRLFQGLQPSRVLPKDLFLLRRGRVHPLRRCVRFRLRRPQSPREPRPMNSHWRGQIRDTRPRPAWADFATCWSLWGGRA